MPNRAKRATEALTQNVVGLIIAFFVLTCFGIDPVTTVQVQVVLFIASFLRSYFIRLYFEKRYE